MSEGILTEVGGWIFTAVSAIIGWVFKMIFGKLKEHDVEHSRLDNKIDNHRLYASETYTTKLDVKDLRNEVVGILRRIEDKLDQKVDKH